jgi:hypothetical protein
VSARDFALLDTASYAFNALFSVGFLGVQEEGSSIRFCHDGSDMELPELTASQTVLVHPCYWRALDLRAESEESEILIRVDDEEDVAAAPGSKRTMQDLRLRRLGQTVEEFNRIPEGAVGARQFEDWVLSTIRYLTAGKGLDNIQPRPNPDSVQQRDIVGANRGEGSFWRKMERQYGVSQFVIECKNFREMDADVFRQAASYLVPPYGRCLMIVTRAQSDAITKVERTWVAELYRGEPKKLVILLPAVLLHRALRKMRSSENRDEYFTKMLSKRLDRFERDYVSQRSARLEA